MPTLDRAPAQTLILSNKTWQDFEQIERLFEGTHARLSFFNGEIQIRMPGQAHELFSRILFFLLSTYCLDRRIPFIPTGSFTQKRPEVAAAEADESYCFGSRKAIPDLSIEITFTSGSESKLDKYRALGVPEVWFWEDGVLRLHRLRGTGYESITESEIDELRELNIALFAQCVLIAETDMIRAVDILRGGN